MIERSPDCLGDDEVQPCPMPSTGYLCEPCMAFNGPLPVAKLQQILSDQDLDQQLAPDVAYSIRFWLGQVAHLTQENQVLCEGMDDLAAELDRQAFRRQRAREVRESMREMRDLDYKKATP